MSPPTTHSSLDAQFLEPESQDQIPVGGVPAPPTSPPHDLEVQERAGDLQPLAAAGPVSADALEGPLETPPPRVSDDVGKDTSQLVSGTCKDDDVWVPSALSGYLASDSLAMHFSLYSHA